MKSGENKFSFALILTVFVLLISVSFISATSTGKALAPETVITGKVYYADSGSPVAGANVLITCGLARETTTTFSDGTYYFNLLKKQCKKGNEATVTATLSAKSGHATNTIVGKNTVIDVPFGEAADKTMVTGVIYGSDLSSPISGADVTVVCNENTQTTTSNSDGTYFVFFSQSQCSEDDIAMVTAVKGEASGSNSGVVHDGVIGSLDVAVVNVPLVPEFGPIAGVLTVLGAVGTFFVIRKKQHIRIKK
jgi:hypothetical protein